MSFGHSSLSPLLICRNILHIEILIHYFSSEMYTSPRVVCFIIFLMVFFFPFLIHPPNFSFVVSFSPYLSNS